MQPNLQQNNTRIRTRNMVKPTFQFKRKNKRGKNIFAINRLTFPSSKQVPKILTVKPLKSVTASLKIYHKL